MGNTTDRSRQQLPLWEMLILLAFFVGLALLARVPAELGKHGFTATEHGNAAPNRSAEAVPAGAQP
jgi:hypothetical protein